ncbi:AI-2E family transporter [Leisingera daeponensis]|uniref:AI-2E family transporter n=1 Tax=Leisingera daeponensis TaxID=405746 RepID=A0ABS7NJV7_9RHOB|nr:AI-2E family transporter [Leisingera daeponensis]MBY6141493.1 AI-2E family transporter [Leisingera daeponensis]
MPGYLKTVLSGRGVRVMLMILTVISITAALQLAQQILAPMSFALVLGVVVSPLADRLSRHGVPRLAIALSLLVASTLFVAVILLLIEPLIGVLIEELPRIKTVMARLIDQASSLLRGIETISQEIEESVGAESVEPQTAIPSVGDALWLAPSFVSQVFIFIGTLFFFTLTRNELYDLTGPLKPRLKHADKVVSRYFAAITLVNTGLGAVTAAAMMALGVEYALLWGLAAGLLNYILYLGPLLITAGLVLAGILQFHGAYAVLPPLAFLLINLTEANVVTPLVVGQRMSMNPLLIFLVIVFGLWLWGPVGAFVALPLLLWLSVLLEPQPGAMDQPGGDPLRKVI